MLDSTGAELESNNVPSIIFGELATLEVQFLNSETIDSTTGLFSDPYTGFANMSIAATAVVDNDYNWFDSATLAQTLQANTAVPTLSLNYSPASTPPRPCGKLKIGSESVYYCAIAETSEGVYTLTLSDDSYEAANFTPANTYAAKSAVTIYPACLIKTQSLDIDQTYKGTGKFIVPLNAGNIVMQSQIEGQEELTGCYFELKIYESGSIIKVVHCPITIESLIDYGGPSGDNPDSTDDCDIKTYFGPTLNVASGATISALKCCYCNSAGAAVLTSADTAHAGLFAGISQTAAAAGNLIVLLVSGIMEDSSWNWGLGPIYVGVDGSLTQTAPTTGFQQQIATPISATKITVNAQMPITL